MNQKDLEIYEKISKKIIANVEEKLTSHIGKKESGKIIKMGADGTPTQYIDIIAENEVINILKENNFKTLLISEEIGELKLGNGKQEEVKITEELKNIAKKDKIEDKIDKNNINETVKTNIDSKDSDIPKAIFLVDPLDGTNNAVKKIPMYGISIAIANIPKNRIASLEDVELGFIKNFTNGDLYEAKKGEGARLNNKSVQPSNEENINEIFVGGFLKFINPQVPKLLQKVKRLRILGSVVLESVFIADGQYDAFFDFRGSRIIDIAASKLIIEESGAIITNEHGQALKNKLNIYEKTQVVGASNKRLHDKLIKFINDEESKPIEKVGIVSRLDHNEAILFGAELINRLEKKGIAISIENSLADKLESMKKSFKKENIKENILNQVSNSNKIVFEEVKSLKLDLDYISYGKKISKFDSDMIITLGGDGTILRTQSQLKNKEIPILGINLGTVGFLTELDVKHAFKTLDSILKGNYYKEKRTQLKISHGAQLFTALNEVVIMTEKPAKMLDFQIRVDKKVIEEFRADGLIVSTPSGSTAYSMSAGGPIVDPKLGAFIIIPICPYKLGIRPIVVSDYREIIVKLMKKGKKAVFVMDGQVNKEIDYPDEIKFEKSENDVYFIRNKDETFYQKVKEKLSDWNVD